MVASLEGGPGARLHVWDMATGQERWSAPAQGGMTFSGDSRTLAAVQAKGLTTLRRAFRP